MLLCYLAVINENEIDTDFGEEGARALSRLLKTNSSLTKLDLSCDD